jgi:hypothetical protein
VLLLALCTLAVAAEAATDESPLGRVVPVDGEPFEARLVGADAQWQWTFAADTAQRRLGADELVRWGRLAEPVRGPVAVLADGGLLPAQPLRIDAGQVVLKSESLRTLRVPLESLAGVIFRWPADHAERDRLTDRLLRVKGSSDNVLLANGDRLSGVVTQLDDREVQLDDDGHVTRLARARVSAVVFNPALRGESSKTGRRAWMGLDDGTLLLVDRLRLDGSLLQMWPRVVGRPSPPWSTGAGRCVFVQPLGDRVVYLSDRTADDYRHVPFLELPWPYRNDRNVLGRRLRAMGRMYLKGLGVHAQARLTYLLDEPYDRFEAVLALDDATGGGGSADYHVLVDGRRQFSSGPARGGSRPIPVRVDLDGARRLELVVDFGERADQLDYADWLDARLVRSAEEAAEPPQGGTDDSAE